MFSRAFRKHGIILLATYTHNDKKGDFLDTKGMGTVQKGMPHQCDAGKSGKVQRMLPAQESCQEKECVYGVCSAPRQLPKHVKGTEQ